MESEQTDQSETDYLTPAEASKALRVTPKTLSRMADRGVVVARTLPSGHRRYLRSSIESALKAAS